MADNSCKNLTKKNFHSNGSIENNNETRKKGSKKRIWRGKILKVDFFFFFTEGIRSFLETSLVSRA